jgi:hypothetical protein
MQGLWYGDRRDLVKWGALIHLAKTKEIYWILQVAYLRHMKLQTEETEVEISKEVWNHFYDLRDIKRLGDAIGLEIIILDQNFDPAKRRDYIDKIISKVNEIKSPKIVFLDPDTGIEPKKVKPEHVTEQDMKEIWEKTLSNGDILAVYQHADRKKNWLTEQLNERKKKMSSACDNVCVKHILGKGIAPDMAMLWCCKGPNNNLDTKSHVTEPEATKTGKRKKVPRPCACQCGQQTKGGYFFPGDDAKLKSLFGKIVAGKVPKKDLNKIVLKMYHLWEKDKSRRLIDIAREVLC